MAETSTIFGFMKYVSATDILSDFKKTVDSYFVNSLLRIKTKFVFLYARILVLMISKFKSFYQCKRYLFYMTNFCIFRIYDTYVSIT